jgi:hypothetical protein
VVSLVAKVRDTAGGLYQQARDKYSSSEGMQRAARQASEKAGQAATKARDLAGKSRTAAGKAGTAVRGFNPRDIKVSGVKNIKNKGITGK